MFVLVLFTVLFVASSSVRADTPLTPQLSCWFNSYDNGTRQTHLVMGYENTALTNTLIYVQQGPVTDPLKNIITPFEYNGRQQDLFRTGVHPFDFEIIDRLQILQSGSTISWSLGTVILRINAGDLTPDNICQARYPNNCPLWIRNFCNDASFCNGHEICTPKFVRQVSQERFGVCQAALRVVSCEPGLLCDENLLGCAQPPTNSPTETPTNQPTDAAVVVTTEEPVITLHPVPVECNTDLDCASKQTFCLGASTCVANKCEFNGNYNPCSANGVNGIVVVGKGVLMNVCEEGSRSCISYYTCSTNAECDDGLLCTGTETCGDSICHPGSPLQCVDPSILCVESVGCGPLGIITDEDINVGVVPTSAPTKSPTMAPTVAPTMAPTTNSSIPPPPTTNTALVVFALVFGFIALLIILLIIFFIIRSQNNRIAAIQSASANGMQSRIKS